MIRRVAHDVGPAELPRLERRRDGHGTEVDADELTKLIDKAGKLTDVIVTHRAAVITLKLVSDKGGEALANTAWSVITPGGDVIKESIGAFPKVVLSEGEYRAIAKNEGKVFERPFNVVNGVDGEVEVVAR